MPNNQTHCPSQADHHSICLSQNWLQCRPTLPSPMHTGRHEARWRHCASTQWTPATHSCRLHACLSQPVQCSTSAKTPHVAILSDSRCDSHVSGKRPLVYKYTNVPDSARRPSFLRKAASHWLCKYQGRHAAEFAADLAAGQLGNLHRSACILAGANA